MGNLQVKSLDAADEKRTIADQGRIDFVHLDGVTIGRATFAPGWRWSEHVKPLAGTELCQATHTGYVVSGRQAVRMADGTEVELGPGDAYVVGPGHDAWVVGDEPYVSVDFTTSAEYAKPSEHASVAS
ncbi:MAG TPA: cupin domain-containing protein [Solirubrobacteraceae bacterium]|nr:cupin domain-containing protein [Solirubrobacteraceae bacterium]